MRAREAMGEKEGEEARRKRKREDRKSREREWEIENHHEKEIVDGSGMKASSLLQQV